MDILPESSRIRALVAAILAGLGESLAALLPPQGVFAVSAAQAVLHGLVQQAVDARELRTGRARGARAYGIHR